ncbi:hypothetical protein E4U61_005618 [Claviceps capensis]|nr:hypothetical protein E4U61_005618 [Claviceps capensis]
MVTKLHAPSANFPTANASEKKRSRYRAYTSQPFKFVVGEAKTEFKLHSALVASKSEALGKLIDDASAKGQQGCVVLEDDDEIQRTSPEGWGLETRMNEVYAPTPYFHSETDYFEFLIAHVKIFDFAEHYGVYALKSVSMNNLHGALQAFCLSRKRVNDILDLVEFCYDDDRKNTDRLKKMVASYSAAIMDPRVSDDVAKCSEGLLRRNAEFAADIAWFLACRAMRNGVC